MVFLLSLKGMLDLASNNLMKFHKHFKDNVYRRPLKTSGPTATDAHITHLPLQKFLPYLLRSGKKHSGSFTKLHLPSNFWTVVMTCALARECMLQTYTDFIFKKMIYQISWKPSAVFPALILFFNLQPRHLNIPSTGLRSCLESDITPW